MRHQPGNQDYVGLIDSSNQPRANNRMDGWVSGWMRYRCRHLPAILTRVSGLYPPSYQPLGQVLDTECRLVKCLSVQRSIRYSHMTPLQITKPAPARELARRDTIRNGDCKISGLN